MFYNLLKTLDNFICFHPLSGEMKIVHQAHDGVNLIAKKQALKVFSLNESHSAC